MIPCKILSPGGKLPTRAHPSDAGFDLFAAESVVLPYTSAPLGRVLGSVTKVRTGIAVEFPPFAYGLIADRSSMGAKGVHVLGGVIDGGYRGEILVCLLNLSGNDFAIDAGDRIAQILLQQTPKSTLQFIETLRLGSSDRYMGAFGSTGE